MTRCERCGTWAPPDSRWNQRPREFCARRRALSRLGVHEAQDEPVVRVAHRQVEVALDAAALGTRGLAGDGVAALLRVGLPVQPDAALLPVGQVVEVDAG